VSGDARLRPAMPGQAPTTGKRGIECPRCGCRHFYVVYTRPVKDGRILRRRECRHCGRRILTYESSIRKPSIG
jgi:hypothetical protein